MKERLVLCVDKSSVLEMVVCSAVSQDWVSPTIEEPHMSLSKNATVICRFFRRMFLSLTGRPVSNSVAFNTHFCL